MCLLVSIIEPKGKTALSKKGKAAERAGPGARPLFETSGRKRCLPALTGSPAGPPLCEERRSWHEKTYRAVACMCTGLFACGLRRRWPGRKRLFPKFRALCGASSQPVESAGTAEGTGTEGQSNVLVAYFSWANNAILAEDVDAVASPSVITPGNVQQLAEWVQQETGADLFSIRVAEPYPSDWDDCLARANQERGDNARPELVENVENLSQYDTIFLGYPNWWYGVPMALLTFLESNDFSGKQVYLFCSHGTGGLANSVQIITEAIPNAEISDNIFDCDEEDASSSQEEIQNWVAGLADETAPG